MLKAIERSAFPGGAFVVFHDPGKADVMPELGELDLLEFRPRDRAAAGVRQASVSLSMTRGRTKSIDSMAFYRCDCAR